MAFPCGRHVLMIGDAERSISADAGFIGSCLIDGAYPFGPSAGVVILQLQSKSAKKWLSSPNALIGDPAFQSLRSGFPIRIASGMTEIVVAF